MSVGRRYLYGCFVILIVLLVGCAPIAAPTPMSEQETGSGEATVVGTGTPQAEVTATSAPTGESTNPLKDAVGILVVDFYDFPVPGDQGDSNNCLTTPTGSTSSGGAGQSGSTGVANGLVSSDVFHGEQVYEHIKEQFRDAPSHDMTPKTREYGLGKVEVITGTDGVYVLAQVNIGNHFTDRVMEQIRDVRSWLQKQGVNRFVVNMSVVIKDCDSSFENNNLYLLFVQCIDTLRERRALISPNASITESDETADAIIRPQAEVAAAYFANPFTSPEAIRKNPELARTLIGCTDHPQMTEEEALELLNPVIDESFDFYRQLIDDELVQAFTGLSGELLGENTVYVAASGNDGYPYPYAPALFPQIVSTGSSRDLVPIVGYWPNGAEWVWDDRFEWTVPAGANATILDLDTSAVINLEEGKEVVMRGTSFATAKLSYLAAVALQSSALDESCHNKMIYTAMDLPATWDEWSTRPDLHPLALWLDKPVPDLSDASTTPSRCPGFPEPWNTVPDLP